MSSAGLGDLEQIVLLAVLRLNDEAYAVSVRDEIETRTSRVVSRGAVYVTLDRLERKGFLSSRRSQPTPERGGKAKRIFRIEPTGRAALQASLDTIQQMVEGLREELAWNPTP